MGVGKLEMKRTVCLIRQVGSYSTSVQEYQSKVASRLANLRPQLCDESWELAVFRTSASDSR